MSTDFSIYVTGNTLDLSGSKIHDLTSLGVYVKANPQIKHINLSNSKFTVHHLDYSKITKDGDYQYGVEDINKIFSFNQGTSLDLSYTENFKIGLLSRGLSANNFFNIEEINLSYSKITNDHFDPFLMYGTSRENGQIIKKYSNLKVLNFSHNVISNLEFFKQKIQNLINSGLFESLKILDLSYNNLEYNDLKSLFELLPSIPNFNTEIKFDHQENITAAEYVVLHNIFDNIHAPLNVINLKNENVDIIKKIAVNINQDNFELIKTMLNENNFEKKDLKDLILSFNDMKSSNLSRDYLTTEEINYFNELTGILEHSLIDN